MKKIVFTIVAATALLLTSCYKAPVDGVAKIIVVDESNYRVPSATIQLTGPVGSYINQSGVSNLTGEWEYMHDPALEVILKVHVVSSDGLKSGDGIVRITPDHTETVTIHIH